VGVRCDSAVNGGPGPATPGGEGRTSRPHHPQGETKMSHYSEVEQATRETIKDRLQGQMIATPEGDLEVIVLCKTAQIMIRVEASREAVDLSRD